MNQQTRRQLVWLDVAGQIVLLLLTLSVIIMGATDIGTRELRQGIAFLLAIPLAVALVIFKLLRLRRTEDLFK
jgi:hypothetical protein